MPEIRRYFEEEMRNLLAQGREFALEHPEAARLLDPANALDRDPYADRLVEGFAFLAARIRQEMDAEDHGLARHLLDLLAPGLRFPLPAVSLVEFHATSRLAAPALVPAGARIASGPLPGTGRGALFATAGDVWVTASRVEDVRLEVGTSQSLLRIRLAPAQRTGTAFWPDAIRLHLHGEASVVWSLRHCLLRRTECVLIDGEDAPWPVPAPSSLYVPADPGVDEGLLAMRDFLCADERFRAVAIRLPRPTPATAPLDLRIAFRGSLPPGLARALAPDLLRLHAVAAVNRYAHDCDPVLVDHRRLDHPVRAGRGREILDLAEVRTISPHPPHHTEHPTRLSAYRHASRGRFWEAVPAPEGMRVALGHAAPAEALAEQVLVARAWCCDGDLPREHLRPEDIAQPGAEVPAGVSVCGLTRPGRRLRPPEAGDPRHPLFGSVDRAHRGLLDVEVLRTQLAALAWDPRRVPLVASIQDVASTRTHALADGLDRPVLRVQVRLRDEGCAHDSLERLGILDEFGRRLRDLLLAETPLGFRLAMRLVVDPAGIGLDY